MTTKKTAAANYSADTIAAITNEYKVGRESGLANADILNDLSKKHGKTIPSIRAKLASLKVYQKDDNKTTTASVGAAKKSDLVAGLEALTGLSLASLEAATKSELSALADFIDDTLATVHDLKARI